jgi:hypothetical protein
MSKHRSAAELLLAKTRELEAIQRKANLEIAMSRPDVARLVEQRKLAKKAPAELKKLLGDNPKVSTEGRIETHRKWIEKIEAYHALTVQLAADSEAEIERIDAEIDSLVNGTQDQEMSAEA